MSDIQLNDEQQAAIIAMLAFIKAENEKFISLIGAAGTGKTTTIQYLLEQVTDNTKVCFTAPTNKAVRVLKKMAVQKKLNVECVTIYSLLGLKVTMQKDKQVIKSGGKNKFDKFDLVVIDEMSMCNTELLRFIHRAVDFSYGTQVVFMGDACQLPPVGEAMSPAFSINNKVHLTKVMRQRNESPILGVCTDLRYAIENGATTIPSIVSMTNTEGTIGVHVMRGQAFTDWMPSAFSNANFDSNYDRFRIIAWRNKTVSAYNKYIQALRYPNLTTPLAVGEPIVFSSPLHAISGNREFCSETPILAGWDTILASTEAEGIVEAIEQIQPYTFAPTQQHMSNGFNFRPFTLSRYAVTCRMIDGDDPLVTCTVTADKDEIKNILNFISDNISRNTGGFTWFEFWLLQKYFADIRPAYCQTAHKAQGSTFENVFVDAIDILANPDREEALRCLYVAVSRASHNVVINDPFFNPFNPSVNL